MEIKNHGKDGKTHLYYNKGVMIQVVELLKVSFSHEMNTLRYLALLYTTYIPLFDLH